MDATPSSSSSSTSSSSLPTHLEAHSHRPTSSSSSSSPSSSSSSFPDRKRFIATLGGSAFFLGLTGATIYGLRKARAQALKQAQQAALTAVETSSSASAPIATAPATSLRTASTTMAKAAPTSVFDDATNSSLPGVLRRRVGTRSPVSATAPVSLAASPHTTPSSGSTSSIAFFPPASGDDKLDHTEMDSTLDFLGLATPLTATEHDAQTCLSDSLNDATYRPTSFGETPVGLSLKAFATATAIVLGLSGIVVETTRRTLDVSTLDEFVLKMSEIIPSQSSGSQVLGGLSPSLRTTTDAQQHFEREGGEKKRRLMTLSETMDALAAAPSLEAWFATLKTQLDAERDEEVSKRFRPLVDSSTTPRRNDSISPSFDIQSPLEDFSPSSTTTRFQTTFQTYTLSISPLLLLTAFSFGFISGLTSAGKKASMVFMAENAHRLPDTVQGWYFYNKTKNYRIILKGLQGGLKQGGRMMVWTGAFCFADRLAEMTRMSVRSCHSSRNDSDDDVEGQVGNLALIAAGRATKMLGHWTDGAVAGMVTASIAVSLYRLTKTPAVRLLQLGVLAGGLTGALRDAQERLVHHDMGGIASHT